MSSQAPEQQIVIRVATAADQRGATAVENAVWHPVLRMSRGLPPYRFEPALHVVGEVDGQIVATADACLLRWDGDPDTLPAGGWLEAYHASQQPDAGPGNWACVLGTSILPTWQGSGLAGRMLEALKDQAVDAGLAGMVAPTRPTQRQLMPHLTIEQYAEVRLPDGRRFDPWLRLHEAIGGRIVGTTTDSLRLWATRVELERWLGLRLPASGRLACPGTIGWLEMEADRGWITEDSVWVVHDAGVEQARR